jgi:hypothetical protein
MPSCTHGASYCGFVLLICEALLHRASRCVKQ